MLIFFWANNAAAAVFDGSFGHPFSGIRPLTPGMLKAMQRREERRAREKRLRADDEEAALVLLED